VYGSGSLRPTKLLAGFGRFSFIFWGRRTKGALHILGKYSKREIYSHDDNVVPGARNEMFLDLDIELLVNTLDHNVLPHRTGIFEAKKVSPYLWFWIFPSLRLDCDVFVNTNYYYMLCIIAHPKYHNHNQ